MKKTVTRWPIAILAVLLACGLTARRATVAARLLGCYSVELGSWTRPINNSIAALYLPPPVFRLDTAQRRGPRGVVSGAMVVTPRSPQSPPQNDFPPGWELGDRDSVLVFWSDGSSGIKLRLSTDHDPWTGFAEVTSDASSSDEQTTRASAMVRTTQCNGL